jgi:hypothetical protein
MCPKSKSNKPREMDREGKEIKIIRRKNKMGNKFKTRSDMKLNVISEIDIHCVLFNSIHCSKVKDISKIISPNL